VKKVPPSSLTFSCLKKYGYKVATLDEGPKVQWTRSILVDESHKLNPWWWWPLDEGPRPKSGKSRLNLHDTNLEGKSIGSHPKRKSSKGKSSCKPRCKLGSKARFKLKDSILLQTSPNCFLGIWTLDPQSEAGLRGLTQEGDPINLMCFCETLANHVRKITSC
jgi:hypothetical protein